MKLKHRNFASKLSFYIVIGTALLFLAMFAAVTILAIRSIKDEASESASKTLDATIAKVENTMQQVELATQNLAWVVMADLNDAEGMFTIGASALKANDILYGNSIAFEPDFYPSKGEYYMVYSFKGPDGTINTSQTGGYDYDYFNMEWYQGAKLLGKPYWSEPYFDEGGGEAMMTTYTVPLFGKNGEFIGVVTGDILLEKLTSIVTGFQAFEDSFNALLSNTGTYLSHKDPRLVFNHTMISSALAINSAELLEAGMEIRHNDRGYKEFKDDNDKRNFVVYGHLSNGWAVGIICPINSLFKKSNQFGLIMLLAILLGLYLVYFINKKLINRLTQPITEFAYSAQTIAKGNFNARIPEVNSEDELKQHGEIDAVRFSAGGGLSNVFNPSDIKPSMSVAHANRDGSGKVTSFTLNLYGAFRTDDEIYAAYGASDGGLATGLWERVELVGIAPAGETQVTENSSANRIVMSLPLSQSPIAFV